MNIFFIHLLISYSSHLIMKYDLSIFYIQTFLTFISLIINPLFIALYRPIFLFLTYSPLFLFIYCLLLSISFSYSSFVHIFHTIHSLIATDVKNVGVCWQFIFFILANTFFNCLYSRLFIYNLSLLFSIISATFPSYFISCVINTSII